MGDQLVSIAQQNLQSFNEIKFLINEIVNDPLYNPSYNFLVDLREIKYTPIIKEMQEFAQYIISIKDFFQGNTAIISNNEVHQYLFKLAMITVSKQGLQSRIFSKPEYAVIWLNEINSNNIKNESVVSKSS